MDPPIALVGAPFEVAAHRLEHRRRIDPAWVQGAWPNLRREAQVYVPRQGDACRQVELVGRVALVEHERLALGRSLSIEAAMVGAADADLPIGGPPNEARLEAGAHR